MVAFFISVRYFSILFPGQDMIDFYLGEELCIHLDLTKTLCFLGFFLFVWSLLNRVPCVSCVSVWSISPRARCQAAKSVSTSHIYVLTCQRASKRVNVPNACQFFILACQVFNFACQTARQNLQLFFKIIIFFYISNICIPNVFYRFYRF